MTQRPAPTDAQLREAYARAGLDALGITFDAAMADPTLAAALRGTAQAGNHWAARNIGPGGKWIELTHTED